MSELDSDMADITQEPQAERVLCEEDDSVLEDDTRMALRAETPTEPEPISASSQIASSLGINPYTLQVFATFTSHRQTLHKHVRFVFIPHLFLGLN